jgi:hypothetical protein
MSREAWQMRRTRILIVAAVALGVTAAGASIAVIESGQSRHISGVRAVASVIVLAPHFGCETFAPPPANETPALTVHEAAVRGEKLPPGKAIPPGVWVRLGLFTLPVGPVASCDGGCKGDTVVKGIAYSSYRERGPAPPRRFSPATQGRSGPARSPDARHRPRRGPN